MPDYLVIEWKRDAVRLLAAEVDDSGIRLQSNAIVAWKEDLDSAADSQATGEWLRSELERLGLLGRKAIVLLPHSDVAMRMLSLPDANDDALPDLVRYQTSARSTVPIDQLVVDYLPLETAPTDSGRWVLSAMVPVKLVQHLQECANIAGVELYAIGSSAVGTCQAIACSNESSASTPNARALVVVADGERMELSLLGGSDVLFSHVVRGGIAEVKRVLLSHDAEIGEAGLAHAWLVCTEANASDLRTQLVEAIDCDVALVDPFTESRSRLVTGTPPEQPTEFVAALGALLGQLEPVVSELNFLRPRGREQQPDRTALYGGLALAAIVAIILCVYSGSRMYLSSLTDQVADRQRAEKKLDSILARGQATLELNAQLDDWELQRADWLAEMVSIGKAMPDAERLYLRCWRFDTAPGAISATIQADGFARQREDVESFNNQLAIQTGLRIRPKPIGSNQGDSEYTVDFQLDAEATDSSPKEQP